MLLSVAIGNKLQAQGYSCDDSLMYSSSYQLELHITFGRNNSLRVLPDGIISFYHVFGNRRFINKVYKLDSPYHYCKLIEFCKESDIFNYVANEHQKDDRNQIDGFTYYDRSGKMIITTFPNSYRILLYDPNKLKSISFDYIMCDPKINKLIELINNCIPRKHYERLRLNKNGPYCAENDYFPR